jgi:hypothetical protein
LGVGRDPSQPQESLSLYSSRLVACATSLTVSVAVCRGGGARGQSRPRLVHAALPTQPPSISVCQHQVDLHPPLSTPSRQRDEIPTNDNNEGQHPLRTSAHTRQQPQRSPPRETRGPHSPHTCHTALIKTPRRRLLTATTGKKAVYGRDTHTDTHIVRCVRTSRG